MLKFERITADSQKQADQTREQYTALASNIVRQFGKRLPCVNDAAVPYVLQVFLYYVLVNEYEST